MPFPGSNTRLPKVGIDALLEDQERLASWKTKRVGLISNQASLTADFLPSAYALQARLGASLCCLFTLEHGWSAFCAEGKHIDNSTESYTKLPLYSLYGTLFKDNVRRLQELDVLVIDVQDVGVRCYTYAATCAKALEEAALNNYSLEFIVCDRPNPLGSSIKGPSMDVAHQSLVSYIDVPFQHGQTIGQLLASHHKTIRNPLTMTVILSPDQFDPTAHLWIPPSPGLPDWESVYLYPGLVLLEGTNVSEGRGSSLPFKCVAAPQLNPMILIETLTKIPKSGVVANPLSFTPTHGKLTGKECQGIQIHITDYQIVDGLLIGTHLLQALVCNYPQFEWVQSGNKYWIDALTGGSSLRASLDISV